MRRALAGHEGPNVYLLGPRSVISGAVESQLRKGKLAGSVNRIEGRTPVENAIAFARYEKGDFGWGIVVPGYNFAIANADRPLDVAAAASLATRGVFAPLLLTDDAAELPQPLEAYLLSVQPGYEDDPGQAVYNRAWILGDDKAISVERAGAHRRDDGADPGAGQRALEARRSRAGYGRPEGDRCHQGAGRMPARGTLRA